MRRDNAIRYSVGFVSGYLQCSKATQSSGTIAARTPKRVEPPPLTEVCPTPGEKGRANPVFISL